MKKIICMMMSLFLIGGCSIAHKDNDPVALTPQEVINKLQDEKQNSFLLYLTTDNCYTCSEYEKVISELEKESHFDIYYVNIDLNEDDRKTKSSLEELNITIGEYRELPMTYYFYQGSLLPENKKEGYIEKDEYRQWLKELHLFK